MKPGDLLGSGKFLGKLLSLLVPFLNCAPTAKITKRKKLGLSLTLLKTVQRENAFKMATLSQCKVTARKEIYILALVIAPGWFFLQNLLQKFDLTNSRDFVFVQVKKNDGLGPF